MIEVNVLDGNPGPDQRIDLVTGVLIGVGDPGTVITRSQCRHCQPRQPVADIACTLCGDGPILTGELAAARGAGRTRAAVVHGRGLVPEWVCRVFST
ncbi:resolvase [Rhodococcus wratislaviensis IFP 2016]|nr:resolvase [Rhodococcus wratislaviensis IFP 2016]